MSKTGKQFIYHIIEMYIENKISLRAFSDKFYYCYGKEIDFNSLTEKEEKLFDGLSTVTARYSEFLEDHIKYPGTYVNEIELDSKIREVNSKLK